jgi:small neutral amino acid transporter SnatA (MarC family)
MSPPAVAVVYSVFYAMFSGLSNTYGSSGDKYNRTLALIALAYPVRVAPATVTAVMKFSHALAAD